MTEEEKPFATDYDGPWKEALDFAPRLFLARFQSTISQEIDWTEEPRSLDEELRRMSTQDQEGIRRVEMSTRKDLVKRQEAKNRILSNLQARNLDKADGGRWYDLIDWLMKLPKEMNEAVYQKQEEKGMKWGGYAAQKGREQGKLLGQIRLCQELLKQEPMPEEDLLAMTNEELETLLARLREQLAPNGR